MKGPKVRKRKFLSLSFFSLFFLLILWGCSTTHESHTPWKRWMEQNGKIKVLSTTAMIDDLVGEIGGDKVDHLPLIVGEVDPHSYELVKGDDEKISHAQVLFYNGLGLEHGASLQVRLQKHPRGIALGNEIQKRAPTSILRVDEQVDPHIWMDISLWMQAVDPIVEVFCQIDPSSAQQYVQNGERLKHKMRSTHEEIFARFQQIPAEKRYLVTSHDAFNYFTKAYLADATEKEGGGWGKRFAAPEGLAPEGQLSAADIQKIIDHLCLYKIKVVFPESNVSRDALKKIVHACTAKGHEVKIASSVLYGDAMGPPGSSVDSHLKMVQHNCNVLLDEWNHD